MTIAGTELQAPPWPLVICDRESVKDFAKLIDEKFPGRPLFVASLLDPDRRLFRPKTLTPRNHLQLFFEDDKVRPGGEFPPCPHHVESILYWGAHLPDDATLIVHCEAGRSRSTATMLLILAQKLGSDRLKEAAAYVGLTRPIAVPNPILVEYGAEQLNMPELIPLAKEIADGEEERIRVCGKDARLLW